MLVSTFVLKSHDDALEITRGFKEDLRTLNSSWSQSRIGRFILKDEKYKLCCETSRLSIIQPLATMELVQPVRPAGPGQGRFTIK